MGLTLSRTVSFRLFFPSSLPHAIMMILDLFSVASWTSWDEGSQVPVVTGSQTHDRQWAGEE